MTPLYTVALRLRPGRYRVKVAAKDAEGRLGSVEHPFEVTAAPAEGVHVGGALLFRDGRRGDSPILLVDVPEGERADRRPRVRARARRPRRWTASARTST